VSDWLDLAGYTAAVARAGGDVDPFFRPEYLAAAAVIGEGEPAAFQAGSVLYPFLVRALPDGRCDVTSAYGMGGPLGAGDWRAAFRAACRRRGVVSEFVRFHPLLANDAGLDDVRRWTLHESVTIDVRADDAALMAQMEGRGRTAVRKAQRAGVEVRAHRDLGRFAALYDAAMERVGAAAFYRFPEAFFAGLERLGDAALVLDAGAAAGLFLCGGGVMHYFLAGSTPEARELAAANLVLFEAMRHAREHGLHTLYLGGGLRAGDPLHRFKQSMGSGRVPVRFGAAVHDEPAYAELCAVAGVPADDPFFPAYRRPPSAPA
jgi:GNAT acetyltransferase-like protein